MNYWNRDGEKIGAIGEKDATLKWARMFEDPEYRIVAVDQDGEAQPMISTIWQGLDLNHSLHQDREGFVPAIFETVYMVANENGGAEIQDRWFSATEGAALETHALACRIHLNREPAPDGGLKSEIIRRERGE